MEGSHTSDHSVARTNGSLWRFDIGYAVFFAMFFFKVIFSGAHFVGLDLMFNFYPQSQVIADAFRGHGSMLWDPGVDHGMPLLGRWSPTVFYPTQWLLTILPAPTTWSVTYILHCQLAASSTMRLARCYGAARDAAWVAGLGYACGGYLLSMLDVSTYFLGAALLPLSLLAAHRLWERPDIGRATTLAAVLALQVFANDLQLLAYECVVLLPVLIIIRTGVTGTAGRILAWTAAAGALALGLSACVLFPAFEHALQSVRSSGMDPAELTYWSFHPLRLVEFASPFVFGMFSTTVNWWARSVVNGPVTLPWSLSVYAGLLPLAGLALLPFRTRARDVWAWLVASIVFLLLSFGLHTPFHHLFTGLLPGADRFRYPEKFLPFVSLGLVILGAMGLSRLWVYHTAGEARSRWRPVALIGAVAALIATALVLIARLDAEGSDWMAAFIATQHAAAEPIAARTDLTWSLWRSFAIAATLLFLLTVGPRLRAVLATAILITIAVIDMFTAGGPLLHVGGLDWLHRQPALCGLIPHALQNPPPLVWRNNGIALPTSPDGVSQREAVERLREWHFDTLRPNTGVPSCVRYSDGYEAGKLMRHDSLMRMLSKDRERLLTIMGVTYQIDRVGSAAAAGRREYARDASTDVAVYQVDGLPYAHPVFSVSTALNLQDALVQLAAPTFDPRLSAIFEMNGPAAPLAPTQAETRIRHWEPGSVEIAATYGSTGYLIVLETWYPGWQALLDGKPHPIFPANGAFIGLQVPEGEHTISLVFSPPGQKVANAVSVATSLLAIGLVVWSVARSQRRATRAD